MMDSSARLALHEVIFPIWLAVDTPEDSHAFELLLLLLLCRVDVQRGAAREVQALGSANVDRSVTEQRRFWKFGKTLDALVFSMHFNPRYAPRT